MTLPPGADTAVVDHFRRASTSWGDRYERTPRRMSDLDLQLRRTSVLALLEPKLRTAATALDVLDVGCGTGSLLRTLSAWPVRLHGGDLVPQMVAETSRRLPGADLRVADATQLPWARETMDIVTCTGVLEYLDEPACALREMHRVLRPGGTLVVSFPNRRSLFRRASRWETAAESLAAGLWRRLRGAAPRESGRPAYQHRDVTRNEACRMLRDAGFIVESARCHTYGLWGRVGRTRLALALSQGLSRHLPTPNAATGWLACTLVFRAGKAREGA